MNEHVNEEFDENGNFRTENNRHQNKLQFRKEAQLLAVILGQENQKTENQSEIDSNANLIKKKDSKFWLNIDLDLEDEIEKAIDSPDLKEDQIKSENELNKIDYDKQVDKLEKAFEELNNKENDNHRLNLLKIKQQLDAQSDSNQSEPNLLELLDAEC